MAHLKPPSERMRRNYRNEVGALSIIQGDRVELPALSEIWCGERDPLPATEWAWSNVISATHIRALIETTSDLAELLRWAELYDERGRAWKGYQSERLVLGANGVLILNPLWSVVRHCDAELGKLADRFGLNLIGRMRLGIELADAHKGLTEAQRLNDLASGDSTPDAVIDIDTVRGA